MISNVIRTCFLAALAVADKNEISSSSTFSLYQWNGTNMSLTLGTVVREFKIFPQDASMQDVQRQYSRFSNELVKLTLVLLLLRFFAVLRVTV